jgi:hypothetical protein
MRAVAALYLYTLGLVVKCSLDSSDFVRLGSSWFNFGCFRRRSCLDRVESYSKQQNTYLHAVSHLNYARWGSARCRCAVFHGVARTTMFWRQSSRSSAEVSSRNRFFSQQREHSRGIKHGTRLQSLRGQREVSCVCGCARRQFPLEMQLGTCAVSHQIVIIAILPCFTQFLVRICSRVLSYDSESVAVLENC